MKCISLGGTKTYRCKVILLTQRPNVLVLVGLCLPPLDGYFLDVAKQLDNLLGTIAHCDILEVHDGERKGSICTIDAKLLPLVVYAGEVAEDFDS